MLIFNRSFAIQNCIILIHAATHIKSVVRFFIPASERLHFALALVNVAVGAAHLLNWFSFAAEGTGSDRLGVPLLGHAVPHRHLENVFPAIVNEAHLEIGHTSSLGATQPAVLGLHSADVGVDHSV